MRLISGVWGALLGSVAITVVPTENPVLCRNSDVIETVDELPGGGR
jgi:hypothetical protein